MDFPRVRRSNCRENVALSICLSVCQGGWPRGFGEGPSFRLTAEGRIWVSVPAGDFCITKIRAENYYVVPVKYKAKQMFGYFKILKKG